MRKDFAVFILTNGRPDKQKSLRTLKKSNYTGNYYLICDNEDKTLPEYQRIYGDKVIVFDKLEIANAFDEYDNFKKRKTIFYARNACFAIAKKLGLKYFLELDDDTEEFHQRDTNWHSTDISDFDKVVDIMIDWLESSDRIKSVAFLQGGDFLGGIQNETFWKGFKRKAMNSFFCSVEKPFEFLGRVNEDVNTYTLSATRGDIFLSTANMILEQTDTQQNQGGNDR